MRIADGGNHTYGRSHDLFQPLHFVGLRNPRFKNTECVPGIDLPHTQWYAYLGIKTLRTAHDRMIILQQLVQPFLDDRFSVTPGNTDHRQVELLAVIGR